MQARVPAPRLPRWELVAIFETEGCGGQCAEPVVGGVLGDGGILQGDFVADFHRVALPAAARQRIRGPEFKTDFLLDAAFIFRVEEDVGVRVDPVHFGDDAGDRDGLFGLVFGLK